MVCSSKSNKKRKRDKRRPRGLVLNSLKWPNGNANGTTNGSPSIICSHHRDIQRLLSGIHFPQTPREVPRDPRMDARLGGYVGGRAHRHTRTHEIACSKFLEEQLAITRTHAGASCHQNFFWKPPPTAPLFLNLGVFGNTGLICGCGGLGFCVTDIRSHRILGSFW